MTVAPTAMPGVGIADSAAAHAASETEWVVEPTGRVRAIAIPDSERHLSVAMHLSPFAAVFFQILIFAPLIIWLVTKDKSAFNDDHGREIVNFGMSFLLLHVLLGITVIGLLLIPVLWIVAMINLIRGACAAGRGELFRYPLTFRFLS